MMRYVSVSCNRRHEVTIRTGPFLVLCDPPWRAAVLSVCWCRSSVCRPRSAHVWMAAPRSWQLTELDPQLVTVTAGYSREHPWLTAPVRITMRVARPPATTVVTTRQAPAEYRYLVDVVPLLVETRAALETHIHVAVPAALTLTASSNGEPVSSLEAVLTITDAEHACDAVIVSRALLLNTGGHQDELSCVLRVANETLLKARMPMCLLVALRRADSSSVSFMALRSPVFSLVKCSMKP
jgi:hypothetical protein